MAENKTFSLERVTLSVSEAAKALGVSAPVAYELCRRDDFPAFKLGGRVLVSYQGLIAWAERMAASKGEHAEGGE